jgi:hypothetical protein
MLVCDDLHKRRSRTNIRGDARSGVCQRGVDLMVPVVVGWYRMLASPRWECERESPRAGRIARRDRAQRAWSARLDGP